MHFTRDLTEKVAFAKRKELADAIDESVEQCLTVLAFPAVHRLFIRTNNALERVNQEIKCRSRVVRIFPNDASCLRLVTALCVETSEGCITNRRFLDMDPLHEMLAAEKEVAPTLAVIM